MLSITILTSCGAGDDYYHSLPVQKGVFLDSPVEGLRYVTNTLSGVTDSNGTFEYRNNEMIRFYIGDMLIGETAAQSQITPIDLFPDISDMASPCVTNLCRFLQSLDSDMDPENGIHISTMIQNAFYNQGIALNFEQSTADFESDILNTPSLNQLGLSLPTIKTAQKHLRHTLYGPIKTIHIETSMESTPKGIPIQLKAFGTFTKIPGSIDITNQVNWSTSDNSIATINSEQSGQIDSSGLGEILVFASLDDENHYVEIDITDPILIGLSVFPQNPVLHLESTQAFTAMGKFSDQTTRYITEAVTWSSKNIAIATVSNGNNMHGEARALAAGTTQIMAEYDGIMASANIWVNNGTLSGIQIHPDDNPIQLAKGFIKKLHAIGVYSDDTRQDITEQVVWQSNHNSIAKVSNVKGYKGLTDAIAVGETKIIASLNNVSSDVHLVVSQAVLNQIRIHPQNIIIPLYSQEQFRAEAVFSDMTVDDITDQVLWSSENPQIALFEDIIHKGRISAESPGITTILATYQSLTGTAFLTVSDAALESIIVKPQSQSIPMGGMQQFSATGIFADDNSYDITDKVDWTASDITVARVSNDIPNKGLVNTITIGTTYIRATFHNQTGYGTLTVRSPELIQIQITPNLISMEKGESQLLQATGYYSNSSTEIITDRVLWESSKPDIVIVSENGKIEAISSGQAEITATLDNKKQFINIVVY
ncbi:MAG: Ig-like repeat-containing protein [Candidatus Magnetoglobus multicellularis str. Araruama]|uniref:Ig-like repeat-containing protein n=1 Tax=Candidatus Magnetoglobus multicellularis str. Araruama TaxID=890399 RepID=A0A1V1PFS6_9BACT|nr:MAG: Ig-like repeat-containing protein [Candidatus Magnetoglobus multicellularis str. Araruama]